MLSVKIRLNITLAANYLYKLSEINSFLKYESYLHVYT